MKKYELLLTLPGTLDDNEVEQEVQKAVEVIKEYSDNPKVKSLGKIRLAYPIKQIRYGYFYTVVFETDGEGTKAINKKLRLNKNLLRAILNSYNPKVDIKKNLVVASSTTTKAEIKEKVSLNDVIEEKKPAELKDSKEKEVKPAEEVTSSKTKINLEDIDKKLDEILDSTEMVS